jgi:hypothetical protein
MRFIGNKWTGQGSCSSTFDFPHIIIILLLLHTHISLPASRLGGTGSISGQVMWDLW